jgi:hypothetical protein
MLYNRARAPDRPGASGGPLISAPPCNVVEILVPQGCETLDNGAFARRRSMLAHRFRTFSYLSLVAAFWVGCGTEEESRIASERARFRDVAPDQYVIAACGTGAGQGCTREVVITGRVVTAEQADLADAPWRPVPELGAWVDQVSSMFEAALDEAGSLRLLEFEPRWHYISEYHLDGDDGGRKVTCFLPGRVDLQQCGAGASALGVR